MAGTWNQMGSQIGELFRRELAVLVKLDDKEQKYEAIFKLLIDYGDPVYFFPVDNRELEFLYV